MKEALGMALSNTLLEKYFRFVVDKNTETIAIEEIKGQTFASGDVYKTLNNEDISKNYGAALEWANALGLGDRGRMNLILRKDGKIVNIDFGYLFTEDPGYRTEIGDISPKNADLVKEGWIHGRKIMQENIKRNKFLLEEIVRLAKKEIYCDNPLQTINSYLSNPIK